MAKKFEFDALGNLTVTEFVTKLSDDAIPVPEQVSRVWDIQPSQIAAHMPMFESEMKAADKNKALSIIASLNVAIDV